MFDADNGKRVFDVMYDHVVGSVSDLVLNESRPRDWLKFARDHPLTDDELTDLIAYSYANSRESTLYFDDRPYFTTTEFRIGYTFGFSDNIATMMYERYASES